MSELINTHQGLDASSVTWLEAVCGCIDQVRIKEKD
jgi:hypothetical protein